jgi:hypothetical protein
MYFARLVSVSNSIDVIRSPVIIFASTETIGQFGEGLLSLTAHDTADCRIFF